MHEFQAASRLKANMKQNRFLIRCNRPLSPHKSVARLRPNQALHEDIERTDAAVSVPANRAS